MPAVEITTREIYDALVAVERAVQVLTAKVDAMPDRLQDHENRLRALEKQVWTIGGLASLTGAGLSQLLNAVLSNVS